MRGRKRRGERFGVEGVAGGFTAAGCLPKAAAGCAQSTAAARLPGRECRGAACWAGVQGCGLLPRVTARRGRHALPGESRLGGAATPCRGWGTFSRLYVGKEAGDCAKYEDGGISDDVWANHRRNNCRRLRRRHLSARRGRISPGPRKRSAGSSRHGAGINSRCIRSVRCWRRTRV
jgi:hypothetical protein